MRPVRRERTFVDLSVRQIRHRRKIKSAVIVWTVASAVAVRGVGVDEAGVVTPQFAKRVADGSVQSAACPASQPELHAIVAAARWNHARTLGAEGCGVEIIVTGIVRYDDGPVQNVRKLRTRVADVVAQVVRDRHVLDRIHKPIPGVASFKNPIGSNGPIGSRCEHIAL